MAFEAGNRGFKGGCEAATPVPVIGGPYSSQYQPPVFYIFRVIVLGEVFFLDDGEPPLDIDLHPERPLAYVREEVSAGADARCREDREQVPPQLK